MTLPEPGRDLDALVAEKVMGWFKDRYSEYWFPPGTNITNGAVVDLPHYSTSIEAAWEVVEKLKEGVLYFELVRTPDGWISQFYSEAKYDPAPIEDAPTAPHAIAVAALKAVGWK